MLAAMPNTPSNISTLSHNPEALRDVLHSGRDSSHLRPWCLAPLCFCWRRGAAQALVFRIGFQLAFETCDMNANIDAKVLTCLRVLQHSPEASRSPTSAQSPPTQDTNRMRCLAVTHSPLCLSLRVSLSLCLSLCLSLSVYLPAPTTSALCVCLCLWSSLSLSLSLCIYIYITCDYIHAQIRISTKTHVHGRARCQCMFRLVLGIFGGSASSSRPWVIACPRIEAPVLRSPSKQVSCWLLRHWQDLKGFVMRLGGISVGRRYIGVAGIMPSFHGLVALYIGPHIVGIYQRWAECRHF